MTEMGREEGLLQDAWQELVENQADRPSPLSLPPDRRMALSQTALFAQLEEVLEAWRALRGRVNEDLSGRYVNAAWTLKDLLAHLASWAREFRVEVETTVEFVATRAWLPMHSEQPGISVRAPAAA